VNVTSEVAEVGALEEASVPHRRSLTNRLVSRAARFRPWVAGERLGQLTIDAEDARALQALSSLQGGFLPWSGSSMRPTAIVGVVSDVVVRQRRMIVECGSGNSTLFAARALSQAGGEGHVYSLDHDRDWAAVTARAIAREALDQWASVTHAPLRGGWYELDVLPAVEAVDLLVVDGPPAYVPGTETARQPALEMFWERLLPGATVILDDSWRAGEKQVLASWQRRYGLRFQQLTGGYAVATVPGRN
jgi:rhodanese-related sulfurtransferase